MATTNVETVGARTAKEIIPQEVASLPVAPQHKEFTLSPAVDIVEDPKGFTLHADLPGVDREALNVRVEGDALVLEAQSRLELPKGAKPVYAEQRSLAFRRRFTLSDELDADKIEAKLSHGVLMLRIPKTEAAQPRQIHVKAG